MDRADTLGSLLDARLSEDVYENMVSSQKHVAGIVAKERKKLGEGPSASSFNAKHPRGGKGTSQGGKFIAKGSSGTPVKKVQRALGRQQTGKFAADTHAAVERFQRQHGLKVDGVVGAQTAQALLGNRNAKAVKPGELSAADRKALGVATPRASRGRAPRAPKAAAPRKAPAGRRLKTAGRVSPTAPTRSGGGVVV